MKRETAKSLLLGFAGLCVIAAVLWSLDEPMQFASALPALMPLAIVSAHIAKPKDAKFSAGVMTIWVLTLALVGIMAFVYLILVFGSL